MYSPHLAPSTRYELLPGYGWVFAAPTLGSLFAAQPIETFGPGQALFWEGDAAGHLFEIVEGCLRLCRILADGRRAIMGFAFAGEMLGMALSEHYHSTAEAVTTVRVRRIPRSRFATTVDASADLRPQLLTQNCAEMDAARPHVILLGQFSAEERVVSFLLATAQRAGADQQRPVTIELPMTRLDIADYLGLTIETVCCILSKLKRDGVIEITGRQTVTVRQMRDLRDRAGDSADEGCPDRTPISGRHRAVWPN